MSTEYKNNGPIYTTQAKYDALVQAGTRVTGQEYKIVDWEAQDKLVSGTNIKTVNNNSLLGSGNIAIDVPTVVQTTGQSTTSVMSQQCVTNLINTADLSDTNTSIIQTTGGSLAIKDGQELVKKVQGQSYVWNQLVQNGNFESTSGWGNTGNTISASNNVLTISNRTSQYNALYQNIDVKPNHKYLIIADVKNESASTNIKVRLDAYSSETIVISTINDTDWHTYSAIGTSGSTSTTNRVYISDYSTSNFSTQVKNFNLFDLTAMGLGNITTVAQFKAIFPNSYYPYQAPTLVSSNNEYKNIGRNLFDGKTELGELYNGVEYSSTTRLRSKNYTEVLPSSSYAIKNTGYSFQVNYFDSNKNYISAQYKTDATINTPSNCHYIRLDFGTSYGTVYKNDIMIVNGTTVPTVYEPYQSNLLSYNGTLEHKVGSYTFTGNESWSIQDTYFYTCYLPSGTNIKFINISTAFNGLFDNGYKILSLASLGQSTDKSAAIQASNRIWFRDSSYATLNDFKSYITGKTLYYELATPTTEEIVNATNVELRGVGTAKDTLYNESGLASWKNGLTEQVNKNGIVAIPYSVSEEFAVSINGQLQHNLEVDKSQQEEIQELDTKIDTKQEVTKIDVTTQSTTVTLKHNTSYRIGTIASNFTIDIDDADKVKLGFISELIFTYSSGSLTYSEVTPNKWTGTDCSNGVFTPVANKTYDIIFFNISRTSTPDIQASVRGI